MPGEEDFSRFQYPSALLQRYGVGQILLAEPLPCLDLDDAQYAIALGRYVNLAGSRAEVPGENRPPLRLETSGGDILPMSADGGG